MKALKTFVTAIALALTISGCVNSTGEATATIEEACYQIGETLPTRSVNDTFQTRDEITKLYETYVLTCPDHAGSVTE